MSFMLKSLPFHDETVFRQQLREYWKENLGPQALTRACKRIAKLQIKTVQLPGSEQVPLATTGNDQSLVFHSDDDSSAVNESSVALAVNAANHLTADISHSNGTAALSTGAFSLTTQLEEGENSLQFSEVNNNEAVETKVNLLVDGQHDQHRLVNDTVMNETGNLN